MKKYAFYLIKKILDQLHSNHIRIEKLWLLTRDSVYWINMNPDIDHVVKQYTTCMEYQHTHPQEKALHYEIPCQPWEVLHADVFHG